jgi:hypothetical protein
MNGQINALTLRDRISEEEFDYQTILHALREYARPRNRITTLLREGSIIRVKKGLYVFGERLRRRPVSRELLSNLLYGPSYVSREYALRYHGLIPEEVPTLTAMTTGRGRTFRTPLGLFSYSSLPLLEYPVGVTLATSGERSFFIAAPEKALTDLAFTRKGLQLRSRPDVERFLYEDLRIDPGNVRDLNPLLLREIVGRTASKRVLYLAESLQRFQQGVPHA